MGHHTDDHRWNWYCTHVRRHTDNSAHRHRQSTLFLRSMLFTMFSRRHRLLPSTQKAVGLPSKNATAGHRFDGNNRRARLVALSLLWFYHLTLIVLLTLLTHYQPCTHIPLFYRSRKQKSPSLIKPGLLNTSNINVD